MKSQLLKELAFRTKDLEAAFQEQHEHLRDTFGKCIWLSWDLAAPNGVAFAKKNEILKNFQFLRCKMSELLVR